ncbi:hypothetical protein PHMEG_00023462 [Phytophthora megakarya]|uniref:Reverse transcriptase n=1 Tax=Phytophthora megakarya TaxID=4795 RepID=A0A225VHL8_9STRA|nr:hypothetical protein PHMEG_00023462 [Phytophthora megakarya]
MILDQDKVPRSPGFVSVGSRRYREWQNLAFELTVDNRSDPPRPLENLTEPAVPRPSYPTPRSILRRPESHEIDGDRSLVSTLESRPRAGMADATQIEAEFPDPGRGGPSAPTTSPDPDRYLGGHAEGGGIKRPAATTSQDAEDRVEIYYHDSGDLSAEDLEGNLAVLPEIPISTTAKVSIEDLQVGDSGSATPEEIERLRQIIWKKRHLLIGKGNALPPAAKGVVCDIDVGNA